MAQNPDIPDVQIVTEQNQAAAPERGDAVSQFVSNLYRPGNNEFSQAGGGQNGRPSDRPTSPGGPGSKPAETPTPSRGEQSPGPSDRPTSPGGPGSKPAETPTPSRGEQSPGPSDRQTSPGGPSSNPAETPTPSRGEQSPGPSDKQTSPGGGSGSKPVERQSAPRDKSGDQRTTQPEDLYRGDGSGDFERSLTGKDRDQAKEIAHKHVPEGKDSEKLRQAQDAILTGDSKSLRDLSQKLNTMSADDREKFVDQLHQSLSKSGAKMDISFDSEKGKLILHTKNADKAVAVDANGVKIIGVDSDGSINGKTFVGNPTEALSKVADQAVREISIPKGGGHPGQSGQPDGQAPAPGPQSPDRPWRQFPNSTPPGPSPFRPRPR